MNIKTSLKNVFSKKTLQIFLIAFLLLQAQLTIAALAVGDQLPPLEFHDQHDHMHTISDNVKLILSFSTRHLYF